LIELLVVIAILMVLAAILLPVLSLGKETAKRIHCVSSLRQLGLATQMYWDDHGGSAFRFRGAAMDGGDPFWFGWLERGAEGERDFDASQGALFPYIQEASIAICPSLKYHSGHFKLKAKGAAYGYGYNMSLSAAMSQTPVKVSELNRPGETALLADAAQVNIFQSPASPDHPLLEEFYYINELEPTVHFRHRRRANVLFCDGHVEPEGPVKDSLDPWLPEEHVGRLRPEIIRRK